MNTQVILEICQLVKANTGGKFITIEYNGAGDSGDITSVGVSIGDLALALDEAILEKVTDLGYDILGEYKGGWEINEGSYGDIQIDMEEGTININHTNYESNYEVDASKIKLSQFLPKKKDRDLFWSFFTPEYTLGKDVIKISAYAGELPEFNHDINDPPYSQVTKVVYPEGPTTTLAFKVVEEMMEYFESESSEDVDDTTIVINVKERSLEARLGYAVNSESEDPTEVEVKELAEWIEKTKNGIEGNKPEQKVETDITLG